MSGEELFALDKAVWYLRRYAQHLRVEPRHNEKGRSIDLFRADIQRLQSADCISRPHKFRLFDGLLEKVLEKGHRRKSRSIEAERACLEKFLFRWQAKKGRKDFTFHNGSGNPTHLLHPDVFKELEKVVDFSRNVKNMFRKKGGKR